MTRANFLIAVAIAAITFSLWAFLNQPETEPPWPDRISGFSFSPLRANQNAIEKILPSPKEIDEDLALLSSKTHAVRTYTVEGVYAEIPALALKHHIQVTLGAWIGGDLEANEAEIERLIQVTRANYRNVVRVTVGNEAILRNEVPVEKLMEYLDRVRAAVSVPVSTAEPWHVWVKHPELGAHVDFVATHMLPFWEGIDVDLAVDYVVDKMNLLKTTFPNKLILIGEVGWPSKIRTRHEAVASDANEATFLRRFLARAAKEHYIYYVMEAFDQPWKRESEGAVGAYWGVYDVNRQAKFPFFDPIVEIPQWRILAGISVLIAVITFMLLLIDSQTLRKRGRSFLATIAFIAATAGVWIVYEYTKQYPTIGTILVGILMVVGMIGVVVVLLAEAHEWAEALWSASSRRPFIPVHLTDQELPMVSVHVPAYNEPPEMMIETLDALSRLDYPNFEVIVIDNNTKDPAVWQPVEAHCRLLGPRFRFFHEDPLAGFKAGALNYALAKTSPAAEVIAVIDSDYMVTPDWLHDLVPQFVRRPSVAIVQAPQDYRDGEENMFKAMCYAEYRGFFYIGMLTRNERNAIIQHGTMTMVRRSTLEEVNGWAEWCITEDAELGLRIFEKGYEALYIPKSYGQGLMPDTYIDFKKQRFRWAYGAVQIIRRHARALLLGGNTKLTYGQRYHFVAGWIPWLADGINLFFTFGALLWSAAMAIFPRVDPPMMTLSILPLILFVFKVAKLFYLYRSRVSATIGQTLAAALAGLSLSHTISQAILQGFVTKDKPFFRTPKKAKAHALLQALNSAREEGLIMLALWMATFSIFMRQGVDSPDHMTWITVLLIQSVPYFFAVCFSLVSGFAGLPQKLVSDPPKPLAAAQAGKAGV